ncbi:ABC transporter ATP-binding protein [Rhodophyticola sp. CCM32]|nr:ABC transporter ATP-binding protein [Rhodophyticola sp. CCM32]
MIPRMWRRWRAGYMGRLVGESFRAQGHLYAIVIVAMIIIAATTGGIAYMMEGIIDSMTEPDNRSRVFLVAIGVIAIFSIKGIATYTQTVFLARAGNRIVATQQDRVYRKLLKRGVAFFRDTESSDILMRVTHGAQSARQLIDVLVTGFVRDLLTLVALVAVMVYQQPILSMATLFVGPLAILGVRLLIRRVRKIMEAELASLTEIIKVLQETSDGIEVIKVFGLEDRMAGRMDSAIKQVEKRANAIARLQSITSPLMEVLAGCAIAGVIVVSSLNLGGGEPATAGQLMSFVTALLMAYEPAKRLSRMRVVIETLMVGVRMMFELLDQEEFILESPDAIELAPDRGRVELRDVKFGYRDGISVIKGMNLTFEEGKTTALVGQSGGGKSTIFGLIMRFFDPSQGQVLINGQDLRDVTFASLRQKISYVGQNTFLFATSVMENLRCSMPDAGDEDVIAAAKAANAHDFITALPEGYDTPVGENGTFLSGGQKQRIAIARAILRQSEILLLDEATSALDTESESLVKNAIKKLTEGRTTIIIAHRLSTILEADKICVVHDGEEVEQGSADELLALNGAFRRLFEHQFQDDRKPELASGETF